jgi:tetratricopeptide (TPR) repeat protein
VLSEDYKGAMSFALGNAEAIMESGSTDALLESLYLIEKQSANSAPDDDAARFYILLGDAERHAGYLAKAEEHYGKALSIIDRLPRENRTEAERGEAGVRACMGLGEVKSRQQKWGEARGAVERGLGYAGRDRRSAARLLLVNGGICMREGDLGKALENYEKALKASKELKDMDIAGRASAGLATVFGWRGDWKKSIKLGNRALKIAETGGTRNEQAVLHNNLGLSYSRAGKSEDAVGHFERAVAIAEKTGNRAALLNGLLNAAEEHAKNGAYGKALDYGARAEENCEAMGDEFELAGCRITLGMIYRLKGDLEDARGHIDSAERLLEKSRDPYSESQVCLERAKLFRDMRDCRKASHFLKKAEKLYLKHEFPGIEEIRGLKKELGGK